MLFRQAVLEGIAAGRVTLAFRRWHAARVRAGATTRTAIGVIECTAIAEVRMDDISAADAEAAGFASLQALVASLGAGEGRLYRIGLRPAGADPRVALREDDRLDATALAAITTRLERMDRGRPLPWTRAMLELVEARPGMAAAELALAAGRPRDTLKADMRRLKEMGLTESLAVGYRLSPRGRAVLARLRDQRPIARSA